MPRGPNSLPPGAPPMFVGPDIDPATGWPTQIEPRTMPPQQGSGYPVGGPVRDPAASALRQEPRSLIIPNQQVSANEEVGLGYVAIPGRLSGGVAIRIDAKAPDFEVNLDISKLQAAGPFDPTDTWVAAWFPGDDRDLIRRVPVSAIPADAPDDGQVWGRQGGEWVAVEKGDEGAAGPPGVPGPEGPTGPQGPAGIAGDTGPQGPQGVQGVPGHDGTNGATGAQGPPGATGPQGPIGATGATGPASTVPGPQGPKGDTGSPGPAGSPGAAGPAGSQGPKGDKGDTGTTGAQGPQGVKGDLGTPIYVADTAPVGAPVSTLWFDSDQGGLFLKFQDPNSTAYVQVNAAGMPEAPTTGAPFARKDAGWFDLTASFASKADVSYVDNNYVSLQGDAMNPSSGLSVGTNGISTTGNISASGGISASGAISATTGLTSGGYCSVTASGGNHGAVFTGSGAGAGVLGYPQGAGIYGGLSYVGYGLYTPYQCYVGQQLTVAGIGAITGQLFSTWAGANTTTNSPTCWIGTNGTFQRNSSSLAYKTNVEPLQEDYANKVLELRPIFYRPGPNTTDRQDWSRFGLGAEDCYAIDFRFAACEDGAVVGYETIQEKTANPAWFEWHQAQMQLPEEERSREGAPPQEIDAEPRQGRPIYNDVVTPVNVDLNAIVAALIDVVRRQGDRIATLEAAGAV